MAPLTRRTVDRSKQEYLSVSLLRPRTTAAVLGTETVGGTAPSGVDDEKVDASYRARSRTSCYF